MTDSVKTAESPEAPESAESSESPQAPSTGTPLVKRGLADMLKGGVIMDVVTPEQARIAEDAGAVAVMALERVPADIRAQGGVARMSDPDLISEIIEAVSIPVMAKARIGHFVEAQVLQELKVDFIDESEVLSPADYAHHINKHRFTVPFVCGATNLGEALRRISEGAAMIRSKGEAGTGDEVGVAHAGHTALRADVSRHALEGHDRDGPGVLGDTGLLGRDDVHDDASLEHVRHAAFDGEGAGAGSGLLCTQSWSSGREPRPPHRATATSP